MTWNYAYTSAIWPSAITALLLIMLSIYCSRHRSVPGALPFTFALLFGALWMIGSSLEVAAVDATAKISGVKFQAAWLLPSATAVTCFLLEYAWPGRWLTRRNLVLLSIPCLLAFGMILTNDLHHLVWQGFAFDGGVIPLNSPGNWILLVYAYGLSLVNLVVLAWLFIRSPQHRWPVALMLVGQVAGRIVYALGAAQVIQPSLQIEVIVFWFPIPMYLIALFGFRIFDPILLARQTVIAQMREGMLVLDPQGWVTGLNPAAERILAAPLKHAQGKPVGKLLPNLPELSSLLNGSATFSKSIELSLGLGTETHCYELNFSPLHDFRGLPVGHLLLLHDVTEQKQAQAQILEQQRSLATLREREQLARELHDSTSQVLGYAGFQLEAISNYLQDGQTAMTGGQVADACTHLEEAGIQLSRLSRIVADSQADIREYILNLRLAPSDQKTFITTLRQYLDGFSQNYDIQTGLSIGIGVTDDNFDFGTQLQLFRIIQEALSNARKHSGASRVQVTVEVKDLLAHICIQDNGCGFDQALQGSDGRNHFGLRFMRERSEQIGGTMQVASAPGQGTCVMVDVPVKG